MKKTVNENETPKKTAAGKTAEKVIPMPVTEPEPPAVEETAPGTPAPAEMEPVPQRTVDTVTLEIVTLKRQAGQVLMGYAIEIGRRLVEVKAMLPYGAWGDYLKNRVEYSQSTADNFMKLFREYGETQQSLFGAEPNSQTIANLPYSKALALLALPADDREAFVAENDVEAMSTRELQAALRAKEAAEAEARNAEESRAKMEADMAAANEHMAAARAAAEESRQAQEAAEARAAELARRLEELEKAPVHPVGQGGNPGGTGPHPEGADEPAFSEENARALREEGRQEAEKVLQEKLGAAERDKEAAVKLAREELAAAKEAAREAQKAGKSTEAALKKAQEESDRLRRELAAASSKQVTVFEVRFKNTQTEFAAMLDALADMRRAGDREHHDKLVDATRALLGALEQQVPEKMGAGS